RSAKDRSRDLCVASFLLIIIFSSNVRAQKISADYEAKTDFTKYKTYAWLAPGDSVLNRYRSEKLYGGFITYAANKELKERGMKLDTLRPDAIFIFDTQVEEFTQYKQGATLSLGVAVAGPGYYVGGSAPVAGGKITASTSQDGMLGFAMYDARTQKLLWLAKAEKTFSMAEDIQKIIGDVTVRIFKKLPVKKSK
ncbi:MAG TPA: DUF4136 domain-containing protein, partial [Cyclobacteriaceae bacterium]|nr:DUF4136 domain-containing protein [Cyclobacteriaceae bacterium]